MNYDCVCSAASGFMWVHMIFLNVLLFGIKMVALHIQAAE